jgi:hypothetical protein
LAGIIGAGMAAFMAVGILGVGTVFMVDGIIHFMVMVLVTAIMGEIMLTTILDVVDIMIAISTEIITLTQETPTQEQQIVDI